MQRIFTLIQSNPLFRGIDYNDFEKLWGCLESKVSSYSKDASIVLSGNAITNIGIILSGCVQIIQEDVDGNSTIIAEFCAPELFGETFVCAGIPHSPVSVIATQNSEVLFMNYKRIINTCTSTCSFHSKFIENMLQVIASKNLLLNQKIEILSKRSTREKLLCFFAIQRAKKSSVVKKFTIPYNREELARYLCLDRSALSMELCKMRDRGLIRFHKNEFEVL